MKIRNLDNLLKTGLFFLLSFFVFGIIYQVLGGGECIEQEEINGCVVQDNLGLPPVSYTHLTLPTILLV